MLNVRGVSTLEAGEARPILLEARVFGGLEV